MTACCLKCRKEFQFEYMHQVWCGVRYEMTDEAGTPISQLHESDQLRIMRRPPHLGTGGEMRVGGYRGVGIYAVDSNLGGSSSRYYGE